MGDPFSMEEKTIRKKDANTYKNYKEQLDGHVKTARSKDGAWSIFNYFH
jgi:hypothetical protein